MATRIEKSPSEHQQQDKLHGTDPNNHWVHKDALRVAIGSILISKRPPYPSGSRSTSGTTSPYSLPTSASHTPGAGTPAHGHPTPFGVPHGDHLHPPNAFLPGHHANTHPHTPSRLARAAHSPPSSLSETSPISPARPHLDFSRPEFSNPQAQTPAVHAPQNENLTPPVGTTKPADGAAVVQARPTVTPLQPTTGNGRASSSPHIPVAASGVFAGEKDVTTGGRATPKAKFIEKLQSKSAWDALIHGSFS